MKISRENSHYQEQHIDYMTLINDLQEEHGDIYWNTLEGQVFIYRPLGRLEYRELLKADISDVEKEDTVCQACLLHPENFDFDDCPAGIPTQLFNLIMKNSFLDSLESKQIIVAYHRAQMAEFDNQITCIISEAFPNISIEEIESWDMSKTAKYLSRAEWKLNVLRNIPLDYEKSDQLMEQEWHTQHSTSQEEVEDSKPIKQETKEVKQEQSDKTGKIKRETIEERQARLAKEGARRKTPEEIAELKRKFPEINWGSEIDPNKDINAMSDGIDTTAPALRLGW